MNNARYLIIAAVIAALLGAAWYFQRRLERGVPPQAACPNRAQAVFAAGINAIPILGTGSMAPYIPPAPAGQDPMQTVVAYATLRADAMFVDIRPGDLCIYQPVWNPGPVMHQAAQQDGSGWIMSGLHNAHSEPFWRVTPANFVGIVDRMFVWPLK